MFGAIHVDDIALIFLFFFHSRKESLGDKIGAALNLPGERGPDLNPNASVPTEVGANTSTMNRTCSACEKQAQSIGSLGVAIVQQVLY